MRKTFLAIAALLVLTAGASAQGPADGIEHRQVSRRAVEAVIWGMPAVNADLMLQAALNIGARENEIVIWSRPVDWRNQTLTPNPDAIYLMTFIDTADGPVVIDVPPAGEDGSFNGNIDDVWQMPLEDVGPLGADKGAGGRYVLLPPGYAGAVPDDVIPLRLRTPKGYALIRSALRSHDEADIAKAVAYGRRLRVYPLAQAASPPPTRFTEAADVLFDATIPYDLRFFTSLDRVVQGQAWLERDRALIDPLKSLGIEKGKPFRPSEATRAALDEGIREAHAWLDHHLETDFAPYFPGTRWVVPASSELVQAASNGYADPGLYPVDARGVTYSIAYIGIKRLGAGQFYLMAGKDGNGEALDGGRTYRLTVPADAPVRQYWSVTAYDRGTHALIKGMPRASRSSQGTELRKNPDGAVEIVFGPRPPVGDDGNWVPTKPGERFELLFRLYAPTQALFDKTWKLPDLEPIAQP